MRKLILTSLIMLLGIFTYSQSVLGTWKTIDDKTGKAKSHVKITQLSDGTLKGEVVKILTPGRENAKCDESSEEHTSELQSRGHLVCRLLLEKKKTKTKQHKQT